MTSPDTFAAGIEAAARVADAEHDRLDGQYGRSTAWGIAQRIRALQPSPGVSTSEGPARMGFDSRVQSVPFEELQAKVDAAAPAQPAPSGWRTVPVEPTEEMTIAAQNVDYDGFGGYWADVYSAMLSAAPPFPVTAQADPLSGYGYQRIFDAIATAVASHGGPPISISVRRFREALGRAPAQEADPPSESIEWMRTKDIDRLQDRIRELEGEVARWRELQEKTHAELIEHVCLRAELEGALEAARGALEPFAEAGTMDGFLQRHIPFEAFRRAREALSTILAALPAGGAE